MFVAFDGLIGVKGVGIVVIIKENRAKKEMIGRYQDQARVVWISEASVIQVLEAKRKVGNADTII
jgi:hypothetical protein